MQVRLSVSAAEGTCSQCGAGPLLIIPFQLIVDDHIGEAGALCQGCLFDPEGTRVDVTMVPLDDSKPNYKKTFRAAKKLSQKQEQSIADELNEIYGKGKARVQPGSGNQPGKKGDIRACDLVRVEAKYTTAESFSLKLEELYKIAGECSHGELAVFAIDYLERGTSKLMDRFAVLSFHTLKELLRDASKHR